MKKINKYPILIFLLFSLTFFISCDVSKKDHQNIKDTEIYKWHDSTVWTIEPDYALDVLCLLNVLTGDPFYVRYYGDDFRYFKKRFTPEIEKAIAGLNDKVRIKNRDIISAFLTLHFSTVNPSTIDDLLYYLRNSHEIESKMKNTPYYRGMKLFNDIKPELTVIFNFLKEIDFYGYWKEKRLPVINNKIHELESYIIKYNITGEIESMTGRPLQSNKVGVKLLYYTKPHGIRITGTRFINAIDWSKEILVRTAIHELLHPPFIYKNDTELVEALVRLKDDEFIMDKVKNHNPDFGYNSFRGFLEEDTVRAMDQIISEKFEIHQEPRKRWLKEDDGMHVFTVALYKVLKEDHSASQENIRDILIKEISKGRLEPGRIETLYKEFYFINTLKIIIFAVSILILISFLYLLLFLKTM